MSELEYRDIPNFPGYQVGNDGSVRSCWRNRSLGIGFGTAAVMDPTRWRTLKQSLKGPYYQVALRRNKKYIYFSVHRLVLETFIGPCPTGMECRHLNGDGTDNVLTNLEWGTRNQNALDRITHGTMPIGESCNLSKLTEKAVLSIRREYAAKEANQTQLAFKHGVTQANISEIVRRRTWKHI